MGPLPAFARYQNSTMPKDGPRPPDVLKIVSGYFIPGTPITLEQAMSLISPHCPANA